MIAHAGDNAALTDSLKPAFSLTDSQRSGYLDSADTETPNVKPDAVDSKASPVKPNPGKCFYAVHNAFCIKAQQHADRRSLQTRPLLLIPVRDMPSKT